jgi:hypothetical protein
VGFLVKHRAHVRHGLVPEDYVRRLEYKGQEAALVSDNKGYRFELTPPVAVTVLSPLARASGTTIATCFA